ncbi:MAG: DUF995 domain-containing protein [Hyphomicrobiaceae bacterium]|nr:MAG: DUF995 domain-containing protein [Hyphomicrobiaceae bacterium]
MRRKLSYAALPLALLCASAAADQSTQKTKYLTEQEVRQAFVGRPVAGVYPTAQNWRELMSADSSTHYVEERGTFTGRWWFSAKGELCFQYTAEAGGGCFYYVRLSPNCFEHFYEANRGERGVLGLQRGLLSNGKMWRTDEPSTCEERPIS